MLGSLLQRMLREFSISLAAASTFVTIAVALPATARVGAEHPIQGAFVAPQETGASAEYLGAAANDEEENDNAGIDSSRIDDVTLSFGRVVSMNAADGTVTIEHRPIPRLYMEPMTMIFHVKDRTLLVGLTAGDKIRFKVERDGGGFIVTRLEHSN